MKDLRRHHGGNRATNRSRWPVALSVLLVGLVVVIAIAAALRPLCFRSAIDYVGTAEKSQPSSSSLEAIWHSRSAGFRA